MSNALKALSAELQADPEMAWAWQCNIAVPIMDATGVSHRLANQAGAHLMQHLFDVDITTHPLFEYVKSEAQSYAEMRIEMDRQENVQIAASAAEGGEDRG
ncbi:hypothetical protein [Sphingomonas sp. PB4P5]|uniref:hypothetical protein n=1 Tax=Parasphingomonas puruogangriensis TaxID=3096155 RepID=UPI002FCBD8CA